MKLHLKLSQAHIKNAALVAAGFDPRAMGMKPGTRVMTNRKKAQQRGEVKHKSRVFD